MQFGKYCLEKYSLEKYNLDKYSFKNDRPTMSFSALQWSLEQLQCNLEKLLWTKPPVPQKLQGSCLDPVLRTSEASGPLCGSDKLYAWRGHP